MHRFIAWVALSLVSCVATAYPAYIELANHSDTPFQGELIDEHGKDHLTFTLEDDDSISLGVRDINHAKIRLSPADHHGHTVTLNLFLDDGVKVGGDHCDEQGYTCGTVLAFVDGAVAVRFDVRDQ